MAPQEDGPDAYTGDKASGRDTQGRTLVPMLIGGLVLIVAGAVIVMMFV